MTIFSIASGFVLMNPKTVVATSPKFILRQVPMVISLWASLAGVAVAQTVVPGSSAVSQPQASAKSAEKVLPLEVVINGQNAGSWTLIEVDNMVYAPKEAFAEWRVTLRPGVISREFKGQDYLPLVGVPGFESNIDFASQTINVTFASTSFSATSLAKERNTRVTVEKIIPAAFFNYDLNYAATSPRAAPNIKDLGILSEIGVSNEWGVLTSTQAGRNLTNETVLGGRRNWVRLETTFTKHFPQDNLALQVGDSSVRPGLWGNTVYFGGVRFGSNFGLTPGFISQPMPIISGLSSAPSTVDMYVNDILRQTSSVPTGPFTIDNFPQLSGGGTTRLVVRDVLGRETVITQDFFTNSRLLAAGLNDWSIEAGRLRRDLGLKSANYADNFGSGFLRRGISDSLTVEGRTELTKDIKVVGAGALYALPGQVLGRATIASSNSKVGTGSQWLLGFERQDLNLGMSFQAQGATQNFRQLGQELDASATKLQVAGNITYTTKDMGSFGLGLASITKYDLARVTTYSANYSNTVGKDSKVYLSASRAVGATNGGNGTAVGISFVVPLQPENGQTTVSAAANHRGVADDFYITASHNPAAGDGLGWRTLAGYQQKQAHAEGGLVYEGLYGRVNADLSASRDQTVVRLGASGGLAMADGHVFATRRVDGSFGIAEVAGYPNIAIGLGGNSMTKTDKNGIALIPSMSPYQINAVRIDPTELPISAEIDSIEQTAVPAYRSAVKVVFPVRSGRGALIKINLADGEPAPAGALVYLDGDKQEFYVARRGEAFVTGLEATNRLQLKWKDKTCKFEVTLPAVTADDIARVGPVICEGVVR
jgi:outer membrane usher protein